MANKQKILIVDDDENIAETYFPLYDERMLRDTDRI